ncbi:NUDIX hydrolase [Pantoea phytobeneficialis]|uniref:NUDIX hydrolase n=1 Tax=Pantoea phytobeneficialis TaxID=2052056 RepID=A0AAP9H9I8_9GAMM|nr:NUDIX hydrolase [Pantoea phytobeneficialis]MDO6407187.1 NUDIX hydrolase [Pantoea phytobeneficialis]QGR09158.1 NUDIX hydrolase [Pantoea phytobeneficialis]
MLILLAGPVRSGTNGDQALIHANLRKMEQVALAVYHKGHTPVIGEWLALPLAQMAGSESIGDEISQQFLYPVAHRLIHCCEAILRLPGASAGADNDVRIGREAGLTIFTHVDSIPTIQV